MRGGKRFKKDGTIANGRKRVENKSVQFSFYLKKYDLDDIGRGPLKEACLNTVRELLKLRSNGKIQT